jgi:uncharacterized membrane protein YjgN (DUF898 family)
MFMTKLAGVETPLLLLSLSALIPIPNSTVDQHRHMFPLMLLAALFFLGSRGIRHHAFRRPFGVNAGRFAFAISESAIFGAILILARAAAELG